MSQREYLIRLDHTEDYRVINQTGVRQAVLPDVTRHNASWDNILTSEGRFFFSLCSELTTSEYAKLAEYQYDSNSVIEHFYARDVVLPPDRCIRDSKFHTSLAVHRDGSLLMATHTTDKAPEHPAWMPEAYYSSPWEGFPGSTLIRYDPKTGKAENLGIPAPRESIYGAAYDAKHNNYYMLGFMRGHLYQYNCDTKRVVDMGQVTERHTYRLITGSDGNIYFSTRSGYLKRINVDQCEVEDLNILLPNSCETKHLVRSYLATGTNGPDGKLYLAGQFHDELSVFDPKTGKLEVIGRYKPANHYVSDILHNDYVGGMDFDSLGVLWMVLCVLRHDKEENFKPGSALVRWDILNGGEPEYLGLVGTPERIVTTTVGICIDKFRDILYITGTNHADEGPDITAINLAEFRTAMYCRGELARDAFVYPENQKYKVHAENLRHTWQIISQNPAYFKAEEIIPVRLWREVPYCDVRESAVLGLIWKDSELYGVCGHMKRFAFRISPKGELRSFSLLSKDENWLIDAIKQEKTISVHTSQLPFYAGRQYLALPDVSCEISNNRHLMATKDGLLAIVSERDVFALGPICSHGHVHSMASTREKDRVYGVAGDNDDLGTIFTYDDKAGLRMLGRLASDGWKYGNIASCNLTSCAINQSDTILAIGASDRLGCVYLCRL